MTKKLLLLVAVSLLLSGMANASVIEAMLLDAGGGVTAAITVDNLGTVLCSGTCGGLSLPSTITPHSSLIVNGTLGQFTVHALGEGGLDAVFPTLEDFNQINVNSNGPGELKALFTDTGFCSGVLALSCFGPNFTVSVSTVNDTNIANSTTSFAARVSGSNLVPATTQFANFVNLTGLSDNKSGVFANPVGNSGSLTSFTDMTFTGKGAMQANMQISTNVVPEPATFAMLGFGLIGAALISRRHRKH